MSKIYILEDSEIVSSILKLMLEKTLPVIENDSLFFPINDESNIKTFTDIKSLLKGISDKPDLLIVDHLLGIENGEKVSGMELIEELEIRNIEIPIIISSGQRDIDIIDEYKRKGVVDYVSKNRDDFIDVLCESVDKVLRLKNNKLTIELDTNEAHKLINCLKQTTAVDDYNEVGKKVEKKLYDFIKLKK